MVSFSLMHGYHNPPSGARETGKFHRFQLAIKVIICAFAQLSKRDSLVRLAYPPNCLDIGSAENPRSSFDEAQDERKEDSDVKKFCAHAEHVEAFLRVFSGIDIALASMGNVAVDSKRSFQLAYARFSTGPPTRYILRFTRERRTSTCKVVMIEEIFSRRVFSSPAPRG